MSSTSNVIARFASDPGVEFLTNSTARALAVRAMADTVAVAIAARNDPAALQALSYAKKMAAGGGDATLWGSAESLLVEGAAFYNGFAAHLLDYDDVTLEFRGHISVSLVPALFALGEKHQCSGDRVIGAYLVGFEVACKLAKWIAEPLYARGWHTTSVLGVVAATAACGNLLELNQEQLRNAIGLAVAQASGTRESFGTLAKPFHTGHCATCAIRAVYLAQAAFTAAWGSLDGTDGLAALYAGVLLPPDGIGLLGQGEGELLSCGVALKKFPNCYATHAAIDATLQLKEEAQIDSCAVKAVQVHVGLRGLRPLSSESPSSGLEAKFNMAYALAVVLCDGAPRLSSFTDVAVRRDELQCMARRISSAESSDLGNDVAVEIHIELKDGTRLRRSSEQKLFTEPCDILDLISKAEDCFNWAGSVASGEKFVSNMLELKNTSLAQVLIAAVG